MAHWQAQLGYPWLSSIKKNLWQLKTSKKNKIKKTWPYGLWGMRKSDPSQVPVSSVYMMTCRAHFPRTRHTLPRWTEKNPMHMITNMRLTQR